MVNLFRRYEAAADKEFVSYIGLKKYECNKGGSIDADKLMQKSVHGDDQSQGVAQPMQRDSGDLGPQCGNQGATITVSQWRRGELTQELG